jgi:thiamine-phosphate pyrophosphorylase
MTTPCLLYYITDRTAFSGDEPTRRRRLLEKVAEGARAGVDYIQLREKDLSSRDLESLARDAVSVVRQAATLASDRRPVTALLINSRTDMALAVGTDGVHLRSCDISPGEVRHAWRCGTFKSEDAQSTHEPVIGVSCHSPAEVALAAAEGATFAVFAPVFEKKIFQKKVSPGQISKQTTPQPTGLEALHKSCRSPIPLLALGGVTLANARSCLDAGAAGIAGIRLFQENDIGEIVRALREARATERP